MSIPKKSMKYDIYLNKQGLRWKKKVYMNLPHLRKFSDKIKQIYFFV